MVRARMASSFVLNFVYLRARLDPPWAFLYRPLYFWGMGPSLRGWAPGVDGLILPASM